MDEREKAKCLISSGRTVEETADILFNIGNSPDMKEKNLSERIVEREFPGFKNLSDDAKNIAYDSFLNHFRVKGFFRRCFSKKQSKDYTPGELTRKLVELGYAIDVQDAQKLLPELLNISGNPGCCGWPKFYYDDLRGVYSLGFYDPCLC